MWRALRPGSVAFGFAVHDARGQGFEKRDLRRARTALLRTMELAAGEIDLDHSA